MRAPQVWLGVGMPGLPIAHALQVLCWPWTGIAMGGLSMAVLSMARLDIGWAVLATVWAVYGLGYSCWLAWPHHGLRFPGTVCAGHGLGWLWAALAGFVMG